MGAAPKNAGKLLYCTVQYNTVPQITPYYSICLVKFLPYIQALNLLLQQSGTYCRQRYHHTVQVAVCFWYKFLSYCVEPSPAAITDIMEPSPAAITNIMKPVIEPAENNIIVNKQDTSSVLAESASAARQSSLNREGVTPVLTAEPAECDVCLVTEETNHLVIKTTNDADKTILAPSCGSLHYTIVKAVIDNERAIILLKREEDADREKKAEWTTQEFLRNKLTAKRIQRCRLLNRGFDKVSAEYKEILAEEETLRDALRSELEASRDTQTTQPTTSLAMSPKSSSILDTNELSLQSPPQKKRRVLKDKKGKPQSYSLATKNSPVDMTECSPYISIQSTINLSISLSEEERTQRPAVTDIKDRANVICRFKVPKQFFEWSTELLNRLSSIENVGERKASPDSVKMSLWLGPIGEDTFDAIDGNVNGHYIHELLQPGSFISDDVIDSYRCLLLREEMKRALMFHRKEWRRSWIYSTFFMPMLYKNYKQNLDYNDVKIAADQHFIGKRMEVT